MGRRSFVKAIVLWVFGIFITNKKRVSAIEKSYELFLPFIIKTMPLIYVSPSGTAGGSGIRADPYDLTTGLAAMIVGDTLIFMDGVYKIAGDRIILDPILSTFIADDGARPIVTRSDDKCPIVDFAKGVTAEGIWFGSTLPKEAGPIIYIRTDVKLTGCTFFGFLLGIGEGANERNILRNNRFVNCGDGRFDHAMYISNAQAGIGHGIVIEKNLFIGGEGYALHFWSQPTNWIAKYNFFGDVQWAAVTGGTGNFEGNVIWSHRGLPGGEQFALFFPDDSQSVVFRDNVLGPDVTRFLDPTHNVQSLDNRFYDSDPFGDTFVEWSADNLKTALGYYEKEINDAVDGIGSAFAQSVEDLQGDVEVNQHFLVLEDIVERAAGGQSDLTDWSCKGCICCEDPSCGTVVSIYDWQMLKCRRIQ